MGTHGRTGVARFFLGSVAARVAATAPCPVLTVRGKSEGWSVLMMGGALVFTLMTRLFTYQPGAGAMPAAVHGLTAIRYLAEEA
jgi:hypothetical protein